MKTFAGHCRESSTGRKKCDVRRCRQGREQGAPDKEIHDTVLKSRRRSVCSTGMSWLGHLAATRSRNLSRDRETNSRSSSYVNRDYKKPLASHRKNVRVGPIPGLFQGRHCYSYDPARRRTNSKSIVSAHRRQPWQQLIHPEILRLIFGAGGSAHVRIAARILDRLRGAIHVEHHFLGHAVNSQVSGHFSIFRSPPIPLSST